MSYSNTIPIFLICDDNYSPYMATMIASVCCNTTYHIEFHVIGKGISKENQDKILTMKNDFGNFDIDYTKFDATTCLNIPYLKLARMTSSTFIRMALADLYPNIDRALVMDVDMISLQDISMLWNKSLDGYIFAAALDQPLTAYHIFKKNMNIRQDCKYANCGIMLIDCTKWRNQKITNKCIRIEQEYRKKLECADQDVINKVFLGNFKELSSKFNSILGNEKNIVVRHFCGLRKPWLSKYNAEGNIIANYRNWWHYAKMTPYYTEIKKQYDNLTNNRQNVSAKTTVEYYIRMEKISAIRNKIKMKESK